MSTMVTWKMLVKCSRGIKYVVIQNGIEFDHPTLTMDGVLLYGQKEVDLVNNDYYVLTYEKMKHEGVENYCRHDWG